MARKSTWYSTGKRYNRATLSRSRGWWRKAGVLLDESGKEMAERLIFYAGEEGVASAAGFSVPTVPTVSAAAPEPAVASSQPLVTDRAVYAPGAVARIGWPPMLPADTADRYLVRFIKRPSPENGDTTCLAPTAGSETIASYLWLSSELEMLLACRPECWSADGSLDLRAVDRLLIGCRWKRYSLSGLLQTLPAYPYLPETVLALGGRVESELGNRLKGGSVVALDNRNGLTYTGEITPDSRFVMGVDDFTEGHSFFIQAYNQKGKSYHFRIVPDEATFPPVVNLPRAFWERKDRAASSGTAGEARAVTLPEGESGERHYQLEGVEVTARSRKKQKAPNRYFEPFLLTDDLLRQNAYGDLVPYLERLVGLQVKKVSLDPSDRSDNPLSFRYAVFTSRGVSALRVAADPYDYQSGEMPVLLDGMLVDTHQVLTTVNPQSVVSIERLTPAQALAHTSQGMNGALLIKTRGGGGSLFMSKGIHYHPEGLSPFAVSPAACPSSVRVPDEEGIYLLVAEGIDGEGNPRRFASEIRVER